MTPRIPIADRIAKYSSTVRDTGCIEWTGWISRGYGRMDIDGRRLYVHRVTWEMANGPIPEGKILDHACSNKACINVDHLRLATYSQNNAHLQGAKRDNTSGHRNIYWDKAKKRWRAVVTKDGKRHRFGHHADIAAAIQAADAGRRALYGEFAGTA